MGIKDLLKEDSRLLDERRIFGCREALGSGGGVWLKRNCWMEIAEGGK
jgi:hypothetical protein